MAQSQSLRPFLLSLMLALSLIAIRSGAQETGGPSPFPDPSVPPNPKRVDVPMTSESGKSNMTWAVYSMSEFGLGADEVKWLGETIVQVVQPQSWTGKNAPAAAITYHPQGKVLVVYNTPAVQEEVSAFLNKFRKALPADRPTSDRTTVLPAHFTVPPSVVNHAATDSKGWVNYKFGQGVNFDMQSGGSTFAWGLLAPKADCQCGQPTVGYPVPRVHQPKHLFHFIVRYEGEGIIDSSVVELAKVYQAKNADDVGAGVGGANGAPTKPNKDAEGVGAPTSTKVPDKDVVKVKWRADYKSARREAAEKKLPLFINFCMPGCPQCTKMDETTFQDAKVVGLLNEKFVPLQLTVSSDDQIPSRIENGILAGQLKIAAYPACVLAASDGKIAVNVTGYKDAASLLEQLQQVLDQPCLPESPAPVKADSSPPLPRAEPLTAP